MHGPSLPFSLRPLEPRLVIPKPIEEAPAKDLQEVIARGDLIIERKRNGYGALVCATGARKRVVKCYTRGIENISPKFPALVDELLSANIPHDTLFMSEILAEDSEGTDRPAAFASVIKSRPERAVALQRTVPVSLAVFNVLVHKGRSVAHLPYGDRLDIIREAFAKHQGPRVGPVEVLDGPLDDAQMLSRASKWEGLVLYDRRAGSEYRIGERATTPRPEGCWKWKEYKEGDFVAMSYIPSTAPSHPGAVKDFLLGQYDECGTLQKWGACGIGISERQRRELADPTLYPLVVEVKFERRTINRRLILAQILRVRDDKKPHECIEPEDWQKYL